MELKFTKHFLNDVKPKRPYLTDEMLIEIISNPLEELLQSNGWIKIWGYSSQYDKYIRIVLLADRQTVHTAFFDRNYRKGDKNEV